MRILRLFSGLPLFFFAEHNHFEAAVFPFSYLIQFRGLSIASKVLRLYANLVGKKYLDTIIERLPQELDSVDLEVACLRHCQNDLFR